MLTIKRQNGIWFVTAKGQTYKARSLEGAFMKLAPTVPPEYTFKAALLLEAFVDDERAQIAEGVQTA